MGLTFLPESQTCFLVSLRAAEGGDLCPAGVSNLRAIRGNACHRHAARSAAFLDASP